MCEVCVDFEARLSAGNLTNSFGAVAQLEERLHGMEKVARSTRVSSTNVVQALLLSWTYAGHFFGGLIAGEGSYIETRNGDHFVSGEPRKRFVFSLTMASWDEPLVRGLQSFLGVGGVFSTPPRESHWQPTTTLRVQSHLANRQVVIPFSEGFLPPSNKRAQFRRWRDALNSYESAHPNRWGNGPSICSIAGCDRPVRGQGLCRRHYYRVTGY
jgi:hypothetical protein